MSGNFENHVKQRILYFTSSYTFIKNILGFYYIHYIIKRCTAITTSKVQQIIAKREFESFHNNQLFERFIF